MAELVNQTITLTKNLMILKILLVVLSVDFLWIDEEFLDKLVSISSMILTQKIYEPIDALNSDNEPDNLKRWFLKEWDKIF